jgi:TonB family protein
MKLFPRLEGCAIVECSAKQHDSLDAGNASAAPLDANTNELLYSCRVGDLQKMERAFDAQLRKAGYQNIAHDASNPASPAVTARKGSQWVHWNANTEDGVPTYSLTIASDAGPKFKAEACGVPPVLSSLTQCEVVECASKAEDSVALRTAQKAETSLTGNVLTATLACPSIGAAQAWSTVEGELKASGFEILFSDREHPEDGWLTGRSGKRWVELVSALDGESISYTLTVVPTAEILAAAAPEPSPVPAATPPPSPIEATAAPPPIPQPVPDLAPHPPPSPRAPTVAAAPVIMSGFVPPKPIFQVPIEPTHDRVFSVVGDVVINILVDVSEDGTVTKAVLTGRLTKNVLALQSAALEAVSHWRFEPARQDGRIVLAVKIPVRMHFHGRPWRF